MNHASMRVFVALSMGQVHNEAHDMKPQLIPKLAAILPSILVALVHFTLSVRVAPHANVVFQRWFDTGES